MTRLLELENQLPLKLEQFQTSSSWILEDSYQEGTQDIEPELSIEFTPWRDLATDRPAFIYIKPQTLEVENPSIKSLFLERITQKWWLSEIAGQLEQRDYFKWLDRKRRCLWVYRNSNGEWKIHGVFN